MHAVFFMSETLEFPGIEDQTIRLFDSEAEANQFVFDQMVETGLIKVHKSMLIVKGERFRDQEEAVNAVQKEFGIIEFFHVYEAFKHRNKKPA